MRATTALSCVFRRISYRHAKIGARVHHRRVAIPHLCYNSFSPFCPHDGHHPVLSRQSQAPETLNTRHDEEYPEGILLCVMSAMLGVFQNPRTTYEGYT